MKIAILTDIHGNYPALSAVFSDIDFRGDIEHNLNPGALGCNDHAIARYAIVELQKRTMSIQLIGTTYDNKAFLESFEQLNVPDREFMIKAFHGNQLERDFKDGNKIHAN
ncbi:hypothetical protein [Paenibacillus sp. Z3-2]